LYASNIYLSFFLLFGHWIPDDDGWADVAFSRVNVWEGVVGYSWTENGKGKHGVIYIHSKN
jgi:hypothetical protein